MGAATIRELAAFLGAECGPGCDPDATIARVSGISTADRQSVVFARDEVSLREAVASEAGLILALLGSGGDPRIACVKNPRLAFAMVYRRWFDERGRGVVDATAVIEEGASFGDGCEIGAGAYLGRGVRLGRECVLGPRVVLHAGTRLGDRVKVQAGAVLGADGFGYVRGPEGYVGFPQIGTLWIEDDVEIGANCTIDRGALGETRIGRGTKIDNLVHIAHNCRIGEDVIIAAQTGIAGSTVVEDGAILGGQVGLAEHVTIGPGVVLGAQAGVPTGKKIRGAGEVFWGTPARPIKEYLKDLARLKRR